MDQSKPNESSATGLAPADTSRVRKAPEAPKPVEAQTAKPAQEGPRATFAALKPPALNLPQGGGAMKSIGETFKANPVTGTVSAAIPVPVSPLPRGPAPSMSISYDSGSGNGVFGHGWSLGVPQIARRTDQKLPEYLDSEDSDEFLFGGDTLVPLFNGDVRHEDNITIGTGESAVDYLVERFRPRIEGAFAIIERWTNEENRSDVHWEVRGADNSVSVFGLSSDSRIADPAHAGRIFAWLLDSMRDDRGNVVSYTYKSEVLPGGPAPSYEAHRSGAQANRYLKSISYGNTLMDDAGTQSVQIVFDYGEHDPETPAPDDTGTWDARQDPFSTYRSGFEVRTYRLCKRVLVFHTFDELGEDPVLVRALELTYDPSPKLTQLVSAKVVGFTPDGEGGYTSSELPSLSFGYTEAPFQKTIEELPTNEVDDFNPWGLASTSTFVDLDGEGIPGVLTDRGRALMYKPNLGEGHLGFASRIPSAPNMRLATSGGGAQLMDVAGSGTMAMVRLDPRAPGFQERTKDGWGPFRPFPNVPNVDWHAPNLRMVDLDGDGFEDILITRGDHFLWYPSLGKDGWGPSRRVSIPRDRSEGPAVIFAGRFSAVFLADMTGDGLSDIVRVQHSRVTYWPNLGYGRFGKEIVMDSPQIDLPHEFHPARVRFGDLDGTGTADLMYFNQDGLHVWQNQAGNSFGAHLNNECVGTVAALPTLSIVDLHGTGMSTLVYAPKRGVQPTVKHTSPFGKEKPFLLSQLHNGMGLEVTFEYAPSTKFYLEDKQAGRPWATKLPFPVQVLTKTTVYDAVTRAETETVYRYHHGHYDTHEREFRGFGMVEQQDAETFSPGHDVELDQHPVLIKTWFHTGAWIEASSLEAAFAAERWIGDTSAPAPIACVLPTGLTPEEIREAHRALKGTMLRQETYGLDGALNQDVPFTVSETSYTLKTVQPQKDARSASRPRLHAVFQLLARESRDHTYDRVEDDPRVTQWAALDHDDAYGFVTLSASVAYARRGAPLAAALSEDDEVLEGLDSIANEQDRVYAVVTEVTLVHAVELATGYRLAIPTATTSYELTGLTGSSPLSVQTLIDSYETAIEGTLEYHEPPTPPDPPEDPPPLERRLIENVRVRYFNSASLPNPLAFGSVDARALVYESYHLDLTDDLLTQALGTRVTSTILTEGGYVTPSGETGHWIPSGRATIDGARFFITTDVTDPFGNVTSLTYDDHAFFVIEAEDALANIVTATHDYRVLAPTLITDPNGNRQEVAFDDLGRVTALALKGKASESLGDTLEDPTQEFLYVTDNWTVNTLPNYVRQRARREHGGTASWQESYVYSDGGGRVAMTKVQAEPGLAPERDEGELVLPINLVETDPRWVGTGRTVVNNKGNPVKQYEPYFSGTSDFEDEDDVVEWGVTPEIHYDALGRATRIDFPDGSYSKTEHGVWKTRSFDQNDTLDDTANAWRVARLALATDHPDRIAYNQAALHANTPTASYIDPLGRPFLSIAHNKHDATDEYIATRTILDIEGMPKAVIDPLERICQTYAWSIAGQQLAETNIDKGDRWTIATVAGEMLRRWDARDQVFRSQVDQLRRPTHLFLEVDTDPEILIERRYYGDEAEVVDPQDDNLKGRPIAIYDGAGLVKLGPYDFKGNLLSSSRRLTLLANAGSTPDWGEIESEGNAADAEDVVDDLLEDDTFMETREYDALNRPTSITAPDDSEFIPTYNEASLLEAVDVKVRGSSTATVFVKNIDYDAKGQRTAIEYSQVSSAAPFKTTYEYDTQTFRLKRLLTTRDDDDAVLQDLAYTFDAVGNIVRIKDDADSEPLFEVDPDNREATYKYDAIYRLIEATGREHQSIGGAQVNDADIAASTLPDASDPTAVREYEESYLYDKVGNILELFHDAGTGAQTWTREYTYTSGTNRLASNTGGATYTYDDHGNIESMPHMAAITYSPFDQMQNAEIGSVDAHYVYDSSGQRVRKVVDTGANLIKERIYLGGYEIYREWVDDDVKLERQTLHVMDGVKRIAMVETKTVEDWDPIATPVPKMRFQLGNHLGSAMLELDEEGLIISYEEYHPYGTSAYRSSASGVEVSARRYRYTGKERDDETGLYYYGARYYAAWLGRWTSADPIGIGADGPGLYNYTRGSPVMMTDPSGTSSVPRTLKPPPSREGGGPPIHGGFDGEPAPAPEPKVFVEAPAADEKWSGPIKDDVDRSGDAASGARTGRDVANDLLDSPLPGRVVGGVGSLLMEELAPEEWKKFASGFIQGTGATSIPLTLSEMKEFSDEHDVIGLNQAWSLLTMEPYRAFVEGQAQNFSQRMQGDTGAWGTSAGMGSMLALGPRKPGRKGPERAGGGGGGGGGSGPRPDIVYRAAQPKPYTGVNPKAAKTPGEHLLGGEHLPGSAFESWTSIREIAEEFAKRRGTKVQELDLRTVPDRVAADLRTPAGRQAAAAAESDSWLGGLIKASPFDGEVILWRR